MSNLEIGDPIHKRAMIGAFVLMLLAGLCNRPEKIVDNDQSFDYWETRRMLGDEEDELDSIFHTVFTRDIWFFDLTPWRDHFAPDSIYWDSYARGTSVSGSAHPTVEYIGTGRTPREATLDLMEEMKKMTDTIILDPVRD